MKNFSVRLLPLLFCGIVLSGCDKNADIALESLPQESRTFISTYFENASANQIEKKKEEPRYRVELNTGFTLYFYGEGGCQCIDGNGSGIPQGAVYALLPGSITTYVYANYPQTTITLIRIEDYGYYLELGTRPVVALKFDREGGVITLTYRN